MLLTSIFSFSHNVFYPFFKWVSVFKLHLFFRLHWLSIWTSLKGLIVTLYSVLCVPRKSQKISFHHTSNNPFPNDKCYMLPNPKSLQTTISNLMKMAASSLNEKKTLWEKEKLLVTSNFSSSFPLCFQKTCPGTVWERVKERTHLPSNGSMSDSDAFLSSSVVKPVHT